MTDTLDGILTELYSPDNIRLRDYFTNDEGPDPYALWWEICEWIEDNDLLGVIGAETVDDAREMEPSQFYELDEMDRHAALEWAAEQQMRDDPTNAATSQYMSANRDQLLPPTTWLVHFTNDPDQIAAKGFLYGAPDMHTMGLTRHTSGKRGAGYNFAYRADSRDIDQKGGQVYGESFVLFQSAGMSAFHNGDEEEQVMFWGPDVDPKGIIPVFWDRDEGKFIIYGGDGDRYANNRPIVKKERESEIIRWVVLNYPQYVRSLSRR